MRFYIRNFILIIILCFVSISGWSIFSSYISNSVQTNVNIQTTTTSYAILPEAVKNENNIQKRSKQQNMTINELRQNGNKMKNIDCNINGEYKVNCLRLSSSKESSIYIPFSFIRKYFEINGKIVRSKNQEYFEWNHSYSKIFYPDQPYDHTEKFLWFENYNVEIRDRVKCISAIEKVPISTQWHAKGHFYPTQVAQYGLSHFNKNISEPASKRIALIKSGIFSKVIFNSSRSLVSTKNETYWSFEESAVLYLKTSQLTYPIFDIELSCMSKFTIAFYLIDSSNQEFSVQYDSSDSHLDTSTVANKSIKYGLGHQVVNAGRFKIIRDLLVDLFKVNLIPNRKMSNYRLDRIELSGQMNIYNLFLTTSAHDRFAKETADWFVRNQNSFGGWDIKVKRRLRKESGDSLLLNEGWHSSMAQGQAMSLLTRLYSVTQNLDYLKAAKKALDVFEKDSFNNGVRAMFLDKFVWYEEYPTVPSIFVLNGFIYSLFGLYDLSKSCNDQICQKSAQLFEDGIRSLESILPLFDSGSGSFYDLRHLSLGSAPNVARWDYHSTHINQLLYLNTITRRDIFQTTADRWIRYMKGHRAPHN